MSSSFFFDFRWWYCVIHSHPFYLWDKEISKAISRRRKAANAKSRNWTCNNELFVFQGKCYTEQFRNFFKVDKLKKVRGWKKNYNNHLKLIVFLCDFLDKDGPVRKLPTLLNYGKVPTPVRSIMPLVIYILALERVLWWEKSQRGWDGLGRREGPGSTRGKIPVVSKTALVFLQMVKFLFYF